MSSFEDERSFIESVSDEMSYQSSVEEPWFEDIKNELTLYDN